MTDVLPRNTNFGARPGTVDMLVDIIFDNRVCLLVIEYEMGKLEAKFPGIRNFDAKKVYTAVHETRDEVAPSDANVILATHQPLPFATCINQITSLIKKRLGQPQPSVPRLAYRHEKIAKQPWADPFMYTSYPYRQINSKDWKSVGGIVATGLLYEHCLTEVYREPLLKTAAGELRYVIYDSFPRAYTENIRVLDEKDQSEHMTWWDDFYPSRKARKPRAFYKEGLDSFALERDLDKEIEVMVKHIAKMRVAKLATARFADGEGPYIAEEVEAAANAFLAVRVILLSARSVR